MDKVWEIALAIIASVGGAGAIITGVVAFCANILTKRIEQRFALVLDKELEKYKSNLSKKEYVSKVRFDKEFEIYIELTKKITDLVYAVGSCVKIVRGLYDSPEDKPQIEVFIEEFTNFLNDADQSNKRYAPFIKDNIYCLNKDIDNKCSSIYKLFLTWNRLRDRHLEEMRVGEKALTEAIIQDTIEKQQKELTTMYDGLITTVRKYMDSLEITEAR